MPRSILSFDVGIRHLAYCRLTHDGWSPSTCKIEQWDVIDLGPVRSVEQCAFLLMKELETRFAQDRVDLVLVERQPKSRSIIMVAVQMLLCSYFSLGKVRGSIGDVRFLSAGRKLAMSAVANPALDPAKTSTDKQQQQKSRYTANKKYAIEATRHYLEHVLADFANLALLSMYPKKDDLCDALLQAIAYIEGGGSFHKFGQQSQGQQSQGHKPSRQRGSRRRTTKYQPNTKC